MWKDIGADYLKGFKNSVEPFQFVVLLMNNTRIRTLIWKMVRFNMGTILIPYFVNLFIQWTTGWELGWIMTAINVILGGVGCFFQTMYSIELFRLVGENSCNHPLESKTGYAPLTFTDNLTFGISMIVYQLAMSMTIQLISLLLSNYYYVALILKCFMLCIYHSFYCFNSLWQYMRIDMSRRIGIHERLWPYYMGYGTVLTVLYFLAQGRTSGTMFADVSLPVPGQERIWFFIYSICLLIMVVNPYLRKAVFPNRDQSYPKISLGVVASMMALIVQVVKYFLICILGARVVR